MRRGSATLVGLLVVCLLLVGLAIWLAPKYLIRQPATTGQPGTPRQPSVPAPKERAQGVECMNNLRQIRAAITMARQSGENEAAPRSLADLTRQGVPSSMLYCPVSRQPYGYQPNTGQVWCPNPEHQRF